MDHSTTCREPGTLFWQMDNDFWGMCRLDSHSSRWPSELDKIYKTNPTCITTVHSMFTYVWLGKHLKVGNKVIPRSDVFQNRKYFTGIGSRFLKTKSSQLNTQLSKLFCNSVILQMNSNLSWQSCNNKTTTYIIFSELSVKIELFRPILPGPSGKFCNNFWRDKSAP